MLRIAIVDRFLYKSWYSYNLAMRLSEVLKGRGIIFLYGPKNSAFKRINYYIYRRVWSSNLYPFQIVRQAIRDKVRIVHIQFEFGTFGKPYTSLLIIPLLTLLRLVKIKVVTTLHGPIFPKHLVKEVIEILRPNLFRLPTFLIAFYIIFVYKLISVLSSKVIVHAKVFKEWLSTYGIDNSVVIPHGVSVVDSGHEKVEKETISDRHEKIILFFGVLSPRKGLETLLHAFHIVIRNITDAKLVIAGDEPSYYKGYKDELIKKAKSLGVQAKTIFLGKILDEEIPGLFNRADVVILPYLFSISASGPLSLAMGYGKPIIASRTEFFREMLEDRYDALLFPPGDYESLARCILEILLDKERTRQLIKRSKTRALKFSWSNVASLTLKLYQIIV